MYISSLYLYLYLYIYIWRFPKIGVPPTHPLFLGFCIHPAMFRGPIESRSLRGIPAYPGHGRFRTLTAPLKTRSDPKWLCLKYKSTSHFYFQYLWINQFHLMAQISNQLLCFFSAFFQSCQFSVQHFLLRFLCRLPDKAMPSYLGVYKVTGVPF